MRQREFENLARVYLMDALPGFQVWKGLILKTPVRHLLRGFCYEPSSFSRERFYVDVFVQPLFVPCDHIVLSTGGRMGPGYDWTPETEAQVMAKVRKVMIREGLPLIKAHDTVERYCKRLRQKARRYRDPHNQEAAAYACILLNKPRAARRIFKRFWKDHEKSRQRPYFSEWQVEQAKRIKGVQDLLGEDMSGLSRAIALLEEWRIETAKALRVSKFLEP